MSFPISRLPRINGATRRRLRSGSVVVSHTAHRLLRRPVVVALGDSHSQVILGRPSSFVASVGPVTMHRAGRPGELSRLVDEWQATKRPGWPLLHMAICSHSDVLLLHFGEIDVRCHVARIVATGADATNVLEDLATAFVRAATREANRLRCRIVVSAILPPSEERADPNFPYAGNLQERIAWTTILNTRLRCLCQENTVEYFDLGAAYSDERGALDKSLSDGSVHVRATARPLYWQLLDAHLETTRNRRWRAAGKSVRVRYRAAQRQIRIVLTNPSNRNHRAALMVGVARYEINSVRGVRTVVPFSDRSLVEATKGGDSSSRAVFARLPDWPEMAIWRAWLKPGDTFVDVGANVGLYSLLAAETGCAVLAIEPANDMVERLRRNLTLNGYTEVSVHAVALMDRPGTVDLSGLDANRRVATQRGTTGSVVSSHLDELLGTSRIAGLKIDVEGNERLVLLGGQHLLDDGRVDLIQLEWNDTSESALGESREQLGRLLLEAGFCLFQVTDDSALRRFGNGEVPPYGRDVFAGKGPAVDFLAESRWLSTNRHH